MFFPGTEGKDLELCDGTELCTQQSSTESEIGCQEQRRKNMLYRNPDDTGGKRNAGSFFQRIAAGDRK